VRVAVDVGRVRSARAGVMCESMDEAEVVWVSVGRKVAAFDLAVWHQLEVQTATYIFLMLPS
jgi:hypothetical protein